LAWLNNMSGAQGTLLPFLYPFLLRQHPSRLTSALRRCRKQQQISSRCIHTTRPAHSTHAKTNTARRSAAYAPPLPITTSSSRLNPAPDDYGRNVFIDKCAITIHAGSGGSGCVSFLREAHLPDGPPNGGDGGSGGNVWIQAVPGQTSLHKIARRGIIKAERGASGQGKSQGGRKGEDVCIQVPVGTVIREIWRKDAIAEEEARRVDLMSDQAEPPPERNRFLFYAGNTARENERMQDNLPRLEPPSRSPLSVMEPEAPISLDLDKASPVPILLAAGAVGGKGNPHFATKDEPKPKVATKGELGVRIKLSLELKLLADVGLVGLPNAGKSTLLRAISNSKTRIGNWAFTTLSPSIGTVILDSHIGRPLIRSGTDSQPRTSFTVADIPGLVEDAHLDKGLGLGFLRHVERARVLAFVIDLSKGDAVKALQDLWKEVSEYENLRNVELNQQSESRSTQWNVFDTSPSTPETLKDADGRVMSIFPPPKGRLDPLGIPPISAKPWFVVATKADLPGTEEEFLKLQKHVAAVEAGKVKHPSGKVNGWRVRVAALPVSAITEGGGGTEKIKKWVAGLLDGMEVDVQAQEEGRRVASDV
jgi:GTPase